MSDLQAPFPYFGGKSRIADQVWSLLGNCQNYVEPFFGSGAVLLSRPTAPGSETVNDINAYICNFWRAVAADPEQVADLCDWPSNESDLHARHVWLIQQKPELRAKLEGDPEWCDPKVAGWWCWGLCNWIGGSWCDDKSGPWWVEDGQLVHLGNKGQGVSRKRVQLGDKGRGVSRKLVHLGDKGRGVLRRRVQLGDKGQGVSRQRVQLGSIKGQGATRNVELLSWFESLAARLKRVRVCCGDWSRICGKSVTINHGTTGVFLDPPYLHETDDGKTRSDGCYGEHDCGQVAHDVREWAREWGEHKLMRIVLCGYEGEHDLPGWTVIPWKTQGGMATSSSNGNENRGRERLWASPHCLIEQRMLF